MRTLLLAASLLAAAALPARAAPDCSNAQTQTDMNICAGQDFARADRELNQVYGQITARLTGEAATRMTLVAAQKAWLGFRDAECTFQSSAVEGGSMRPMMEATCRTNLTTERVKTLRGYLSCQVGDALCPVPPR